jgi:hypothetical protein
MEFESLRDQYMSLMAKHMGLSDARNMSEYQINLAAYGFELFEDKLNDIKTLEDEVRRLNIELLNERAMNDDMENHGYDD